MGTVREALQLPDMRRIELGYGLSITGELAGTVALVVYAVNAGGGWQEPSATCWYCTPPAVLHCCGSCLKRAASLER